jgi:iduronate 2-sulfatase
MPKELEGTSLVPLLKDRNRPWKTAVFNQYLRSDKWVGPDGIAYMGRSVLTDTYRYVQWTNWETKEPVAQELYDQKADPQENRNLARQQAKHKQLQRQIEAEKTAALASSEPEPAPDKTPTLEQPSTQSAQPKKQIHPTPERSQRDWDLER